MPLKQEKVKTDKLEKIQPIHFDLINFILNFT
jgi:hypothetical protein